MTTFRPAANWLSFLGKAAWRQSLPIPLLGSLALLCSACSTVEQPEPLNPLERIIETSDLQAKERTEKFLPVLDKPPKFGRPVILWGNGENPTKVLIALHGFADRALSFDQVAQALLSDEQDDILIVAYDQRSFGRTADWRSPWPGSATLVTDFQLLYEKTAGHYDMAEIFVLGHSMGGAVAVAAFAGAIPRASGETWPEIPPSGVILAAPAICDTENFGYFGAAVFSVFAGLLPHLMHSTVDIPFISADLAGQTEDQAVITKARNVNSGFHQEISIGKVQASRDLYARAAKTHASVRVPVLVLQGVEDNIVDARLIESLFRQPQATNPSDRDQWRKALFFDNYGHLLLFESEIDGQRKGESPVHRAISEFVRNGGPGAPGIGEAQGKMTPEQTARAASATSLPRCAFVASKGQ